MRRLTAVALLALTLWVGGCSGTDGSTTASVTSALPERTQTAGDVEVKVQPTQLDASGAAFTITFDTHAGSLDTDLEVNATLDVNATRWPTSGWFGDPPSGHHRTGTLGFTSAGPATGTATLAIAGLAERVVFTWTIGGS